jgi:hypothetical protein
MHPVRAVYVRKLVLKQEVVTWRSLRRHDDNSKNLPADDRKIDARRSGLTSSNRMLTDVPRVGYVFDCIAAPGWCPAAALRRVGESGDRMKRTRHQHGSPKKHCAHPIASTRDSWTLAWRCARAQWRSTGWKHYRAEIQCRRRNKFE